MNTIARRIAIVISATAVTIGMMGSVSPADAKTKSSRDSSWNFKVKSPTLRDSSWNF